ncbi:arylsulfatase [Sphingopyxis panaciterrulae]|uniref:Arylsulfatase n=1 Tax=Sphingopyxis panaciterrulae TaxID=462372 RepID=A0A7W9B9G7_9SPHN|nr:arylsulfatase [Sphingopyxis panaciterrulae]MBB5708700.1 arylsulfatase [Sphingopyxis panaciterrulae]
MSVAPIPGSHSVHASQSNSAAPDRPNYLVIVADDLGWSDLGSFGGEIETPHLDALALAGIRFTGFHTAPACSPTRAMLMSGVDSHQAGLGTMAELADDATRGAPGYETYLNDRVASIAELLKAGGYLTLMTGKWHLGLTPDREPAARGFEKSFALLEGAANHFGADQQGAWRRAGLAPSYRENGKPVEFPVGAYSSDYLVDRLIGFLEDSARAGDDRPFFAYLAFTAPHWPLQAPRHLIEKYRGLYDKGYDALREARLAGQKRLGLIPADTIPHPMTGVRPWHSLGPGERADQARRMEVYAAMVEGMDQNVGRLVAELKRLGRYDDTVILFLSDNGPAGNPRATPDHRRHGPPDRRLGIDNGLGNIGNFDSYVSYGSGWAQAASAPSRLMKGYPAQGGIRVAAFAAGRGVVGKRIVHATLDVRDIAPTLLDLADLIQPATYADRTILRHQGHSLGPLLRGKATSVRSSEEPLGYELLFHRALRKGDWKALYVRGQAEETPRWQLFNIARDPGETKDLADTEPEKLRELVGDYDAYATAKGVFPPPGE